MSQLALTAEPSQATSTPEANLGAVFTKRWVVDLILDLAGYTPDQDLTSATALEPSVGQGAFLVPMVERLLESASNHGTPPADLDSALIAFDIDPSAVATARARVLTTLSTAGLTDALARRLADAWIREGDFLLSAKALPSVSWVIGNPPYVRVEDVDRDLMTRYRRAWPTMSGRADVYVGFLEAGLAQLKPNGRLAVICADRWMRNQYGAGLRATVEDHFAVDACIIMHEVNAFEDKVAAYPAITVLRRGEQGRALVCDARSGFDVEAASRLQATFMRGPAPVATDPDYTVSWTNGWFRGTGSWPDADPVRLGTITELESRLPLLEDTGAKVSVGVATGADAIFITESASNTEPDRLLRSISAREVTTGQIRWAGRYLVNPWNANSLAPLDEHPGMAAYLRRHASRLKDRHVATKNPATWWRTIDRVDAVAAAKPKLLIPDLKDRIFPVMDAGQYCPSHSLYYITSDTWDLEVLGGLLLSDLATMFVEAYSVRMANGYLRVSAQYLRRVRVPRPEGLTNELNHQLRSAFRNRDIAAANRYSRAAYGLG
jgi:adenine-specific DNA-methyltransferase